jgi:hypothetical protein
VQRPKSNATFPPAALGVSKVPAAEGWNNGTTLIYLSGSNKVAKGELIKNNDDNKDDYDYD